MAKISNVYYTTHISVHCATSATMSNHALLGRELCVTSHHFKVAHHTQEHLLPLDDLEPCLNRP